MARAQNNPALITVHAIILLTLGWSGLFCLSANPRSLPRDESVRQKYFRLTESIVTASPDSQISALQFFLLSQPQFERIYFKLLERYQARARVREAQAYFQALATNPTYQRNSLWALARIAIMEDDAPTALDLFSRALRLGTPSPALLRDFIEFDMQQAEAFNGFAILKALKLNPENQKIVAALYNYQRLHFARQKLDFARVHQAFREIPAKTSHDPVLLHAWGDNFYRQKLYPFADSLWRLGLELARGNNDLESQALFLTNLGMVANAGRKSSLALSYYDSAYALAGRTDDLFNRQRVLGFHSIISYARSRYNEYAALAEEAGQVAILIGAWNFAATWFLNAGQAFYELGRFNDALQAYEKSEQYARRVNNQDLLIRVKLKKAELYSYLDLNDIARRILQEAYKLSEQKQLVELSLRAQVKLAEILLAEGNYIAARAHYKRFNEFLEQTNSFPLEHHDILAKLADTYRGEKDEKQAMEYYRQAQENARASNAEAYVAWYGLELAIGDMNRGKVSEAIQQLNEVLAIAKKVDDEFPEMLSRVYLELGDAWQKTRDFNKAVVAYSRAANLIESTITDIRVDALRIGYFSEKSRVYRRLAETFFKRHELRATRPDLDSLFYYAQMTQGRALYDLRYLRQPPQAGKAANKAMEQEYRHARAQLESIQRAIRLDPGKFEFLREQWELARYSLVAQRLRLVEEYGATEETPHIGARSLAVVQDLLKRHDLGLLLYQIADETSYVVAVVGERARVVSLKVRPDSLSALVDSLVTPFHEAGEETISQTPFRAGLAHRLYRLLIEPVEKKLHLPERLLIVPDLALLNLPFEMLLTAAPSQQEYLPTHEPAYADDFWAQQHTIFYSPTISLLQKPAPVEFLPSCVVVFANPFTEVAAIVDTSRLRSGLRFDPLPFSEEEARRIAGVYPATVQHLRAVATESKFHDEAQNALRRKVFHIASHAYVDTTFDAFTGLVLAAGKDSTDDGMLMGYEIADLQLTCDLIVLSACKTGSGKLVAGEGVLGLPRLFLGTGTKSVLMTLWQVYDQFPAVLMPEFYEQFLNDQYAKADALARARRALLDGKLEDKTKPDGIHYQHPFFWATFVMYGDPGINRGLSTTAKIALLSGALLFAALLLVGIYYLYAKRLPGIRQLAPLRNWLSPVKFN